MKLARITKVYRNSSQERHATEYNGASAVSVVVVDSKLADTDEEIPVVFLTSQSEDDFSYPDEGSIVGIDTYEGTSISFVDHITPFGKLVPGLQAGQHQIGSAESHVLIDTEQRQVDIVADKVRVDADEYKNSSSSQENIADQYSVLSEFFARFISKGDLQFGALGFMNFQAGRFSITGTENSTITATQALNFVVGLVMQVVTGGNFSVVSQLGSVNIGNLIGDIGVDITGLVVIENTPGGSLKKWLTDTLNAIETGIVSGGGTFSAAPLIVLLNLILK